MARGLDAWQGSPDYHHLDALCEDERQIERMGEIIQQLRQRAERAGGGDDWTA